MSVRNLFKKYIKDTGYKEFIMISSIFVCTPNKSIQAVIGNTVKKVFISTRSLKHIYDRHIYDKKVPKDFYLIIENIKNIISNPDRIYKDTEDKRGNYIFVREIKERFFMCTIEVVNEERIEIVSSSITGEKYLRKFTLLWSWETANLPS